MIDYNEMEKVIQNLNKYVEKLQKTSEVQNKLDESIEELVKIQENIENIKNEVGQYTTSLEKLESTHDTIKAQLDTILHDYKNLHSAFELLDIELKKINSQNANFEKSLKDLESLAKAICDEVPNIQIAQESILEHQKELDKNLENNFSTSHSNQTTILEQQELFAKENKTWFKVLFGFVFVIAILTIIGFFI